jgi:Tfp pilus assembly protein PilE
MTRQKEAQGALQAAIGANEHYRTQHAVTLGQKKSLAQVKADPSKADAEEAAYQVVYDTEQTRIKAAQKTLADQITANEKFRSENAVTLAQTDPVPSKAIQNELDYQKVYDAE